jgi:SH3-like domain-containing protein
VAILGTFALISGLLLLGRGHLNRIPNAIILPPSVEVKEGANDSYRTSFKAHAGLRVSILGQEQDFVRVRLANGLEGFVRETTVGRL